MQATLVKRDYFYRLPNTVNFYDTALKKKAIYGQWKYQKLVTWTDSTHFFIDVPSNTIIDVANISNGLTLGSISPDIILVVTQTNNSDTLTTGDYPSVAAKFQQKNSIFGKPIYYYTLK